MKRNGGLEMNDKEQRIRDIIEKLAKMGWVYNGFDRCNYEFTFTRKNDTWIDCVSLGCGHFGNSRKRMTGKGIYGFEFEPFSYGERELPLFYELYLYMTETRKGLPLDMAKHQKDLDRVYKWEIGETYCTFENGVLSCGVIEDEEDYY